MSPKDFLEGEITRKHLAAADPSQKGSGDKIGGNCDTYNGTSVNCQPGPDPAKSGKQQPPKPGGTKGPGKGPGPKPGR